MCDCVQGPIRGRDTPRDPSPKPLKKTSCGASEGVRGCRASGGGVHGWRQRI